MEEVIINGAEARERLDKALAKQYPEYSRSAIEKLIENRQVLVNGKPEKSKYSLKEGDKISIDFTELNKVPEKINLPILYEDENVIVINKPVGILAHAKGAFSKEGTVATFVRDKLNGSEEWKGSNRAGIVHRLDRGTSGAMIVAKNEATQKLLQKQFSNRTVKKVYLAVIKGRLPEPKGLIDVPIERNPKKPATFRAGPNGKSAQTEFQTLRSTDSYSLLILRPKTGRTHQLRVHLNYLKHPLVGDEFYSGEAAERLMLHALELEATLPGGNRKVFKAPMPDTFERYT